MSRSPTTPGAERSGSADPKAAELAADLERLGPTFVKLGQLLSTRGDILSPDYLDALRRLQDKVEPFPYEEVEEIVQTELGVRISKAFSRFDREPIAAASLGQVHRAALRDGRPVAVKVQRPAIREQIIEDLEAFREIAQVLAGHTEVGKRFDIESMIEEFRKTLLRELDYRQEAGNMVALGAALKDFERIVVPQPIDDYTTTRVLTMDFISGAKVTSLEPARQDRHRRLRPGRRALPGVPAADPRGRLLPCGPAPRKCLPDRRRAHRLARPRDGRPHRAHPARSAPQARDRA